MRHWNCTFGCVRLASKFFPVWIAVLKHNNLNFFFRAGDVPCDEEANEDEELSESEETIMMSQKVWDDIEPALSAETGDDRGDAQDGDNQYDRWNSLILSLSSK